MDSNVKHKLSMDQRYRRWLCKKIGHRPTPVEFSFFFYSDDINPRRTSRMVNVGEICIRCLVNLTILPDGVHGTGIDNMHISLKVGR